MLTWGTLIAFRPRVEAVNRAFKGRIRELEERSGKRHLTILEKDEVVFLDKAMRPAVLRLNEEWNKLVEKAADQG